MGLVGPERSRPGWEVPAVGHSLWPLQRPHHRGPALGTRLSWLLLAALSCPGPWALPTQQVCLVQVQQEGLGHVVGSGRGLRGLRRVPGLLVAFWPKGLSSEPRPECQLKPPCAYTNTQKRLCGHKDIHTGTDRRARTHGRSRSQASEAHVQGDTFRSTHKAHKGGNTPPGLPCIRWLIYFPWVPGTYWPGLAGG